MSGPNGIPRILFALPAFDLNVRYLITIGKTNLDKIALLSESVSLETYRDLMVEERIESIFEIGFFQGGMPLFLADMQPRLKIVAVDWNPPSDELTTLIARNNLSLPRSS